MALTYQESCDLFRECRQAQRKLDEIEKTLRSHDALSKKRITGIQQSRNMLQNLACSLWDTTIKGQTCGNCHGTGKTDWGWSVATHECTTCKGTGHHA